MEMFIRIPFTKRKQEKDTMLTIMCDLKEGFVYVVKQPFILRAMILAALLNLLLTPYFIVGTPIILRITMQSNEAVFGIGMGLINLAAIIGALTIGIFAKKMSMKKLHRWILAIAVLIIPMALSVSPFMLGLGQYPPFLLFMFCAVIIAAAMTIVSIFVITKVQKKTPNENLGKVMAIITATAQCAAPVGQFLYGVFFEDFRTEVYLPTVFASAAMFAVAALSKRILKNEGSEL
jgi:MFS family permease